MKRGLLSLLIIGTIVMGAVLLQTKYTVQEKARSLREMAAQIHRDREAVRFLEAEWAYKTTPAKLQEQSLEFLALMPVMPTQIIANVGAVPVRANPTEPVVGSVGVLLPASSKSTPIKTSINKRAAFTVQATRTPVIYSTRLQKIVPLQTRYQGNQSLRIKQ